MTKPTQLAIPAACPLCGRLVRPIRGEDQHRYAVCIAHPACTWSRRLPDVTGPVVYIPYDGGVDA